MWPEQLTNDHRSFNQCKEKFESIDDNNWNHYTATHFIMECSNTNGIILTQKSLQ